MEIDPRERSLFEAAAQSISEGLSMFDAERRLVVCNARYAEIYDLPLHLTQPGARHQDIVQYRVERGMEPGAGASFAERHDALMRERRPDRT